jgi:hypothetical protein
MFYDVGHLYETVGDHLATDVFNTANVYVVNKIKSTSSRKHLCQEKNPLHNKIHI